MIATRYHTGIWDKEDVFQEILLQIYSAMRTGKLPIDDRKESARTVKSFIITKAIDILRIEIRRHMARLDDKYSEIPEPASSESLESYQFELSLMWELLISVLPRETARFIYELAFPSPTTVEIAMEDQNRLRMEAATGKLKMGVHELEIKPKHVSEWHRRAGHPLYTSQAIAKMRGDAQEALRNYFNMAGVDDMESVIDKLLGI